MRWVEVEPERLPGWVSRFGVRHGGRPQVEPAGGVLRVIAPDGALAECYGPPGAAEPETVADLAAPVDARLGLLIARRGGFAVGIADGPHLVSTTVDRQRRSPDAMRAAAVEASAVLTGLDAVVAGGDRSFVELVLADRRLASLRTRQAVRFLGQAQPTPAGLAAALRSARGVWIALTEPRPEP